MEKIWILHEGTGNNLDRSLISSLIAKVLKKDIKEIKFHGMGTKGNFFNKEEYPFAFKERVESGEIKKILFILDADDDYEKTERLINKSIHDFGLQGVSSVYIMCDDPENRSSGYIESFLLSLIPKERIDCIDAFLACSNFKPNETRNSKWIKDKFQRISKSLIDPQSPYNFEDQKYNQLKNKLKALFE